MPRGQRRSALEKAQADYEKALQELSVAEEKVAQAKEKVAECKAAIDQAQTESILRIIEERGLTLEEVEQKLMN